MSNQQKIVPCIWFEKKAEEAANFYVSLFENSETEKISRYGKVGQEFHGQESGAAMTVQYYLSGQEFTALNGNPGTHFNPSVSFFVLCETKEECDNLWDQLIEGGEVMMSLDSYDWSERYGWLNDRFGISWQILQGNMEDVGQKITPLFFFTGDQQGKAEEAHDFYLSVFRNSSSDGVLTYKKGEEGPEGMVKHSQFALEGQKFMAMDSAVENNFPFNESISQVIQCSTQDEIDYYWEQLLQDGGTELECGWLKDKFGVPWQVVPDILPELMSGKEAGKSENVMKALLKMKKLDIAELKQAGE